MKQSGSILDKFVKKLVMGFSAKNIIIGEKIEEKPVYSPEPLVLNKQEVEFLLIMMKDASFKGEHIQRVYELILKLQNYYTQLP
jgi:hypothetical protein